MRNIFILLPIYFFIGLVFLTLVSINVTLVEAIEHYTVIAAPMCNFSYSQSEDGSQLRTCFEPLDFDPSNSTSNTGNSSNEELEASNSSLPNNVLTKNSLPSTVNLKVLNNSKIWKYKINSDSNIHKDFDNVGEPTFASNGSLVFYAGNHYTGRIMDKDDWQPVDPNFDFKGIQSIPSNATMGSEEIVPLFKADQHIEYDSHHKIYLWVRQSVPVLFAGAPSNIERLAVSKDTHNWVVFDLISTSVLNNAHVTRSYLDYPDTTVTDKFYYLTTTVYDLNEGKQYGLITRFSLDDLANSIDNPTRVFNYEVVLDRGVKQITPVNGASNPMSFGAQLLNESSMKLYFWYNDLSAPINISKPISPWTAINDPKMCHPNLETWWCKANTDSRIRSAWMLGNSINFMWNALGSFDNGTTWIPYVDSATFHLGKKDPYERKYLISEKNRPWTFGAASPAVNGDLGASAYYIDMDKPDLFNKTYFNHAFGVFNNTSNKWDMMQIINSTFPLPVKNEENTYDYNFGDFFTTKAHVEGDPGYRWDIGAYVITGKNYYDVDPYFMMIK